MPSIRTSQDERHYHLRGATYALQKRQAQVVESSAMLGDSPKVRLPPSLLRRPEEKNPALMVKMLEYSHQRSKMRHFE